MGQAFIYSTVLLTVAGVLLGAMVCWVILRIAPNRTTNGIRVHMAKLEQRHSESEKALAGMTTQINLLHDEVRRLRDGTRAPIAPANPTDRARPLPLVNPVINAEPDRPAEGFQDTQIVDSGW